MEGRIEPRHGLAFGIGLGALATAQLALTVNLLAAALALAGLLGYVLVYTVWLKPRTTQNIVIGGAAGAVPPLVGLGRRHRGADVDALYPFGIVFLWTPPHFWALALLVKDDYARARIPMLPVARGEAGTRRQILVYSVALVALHRAPYATGLLRRPLLAAAVALGAGFVALAARLWLRPSAGQRSPSPRARSPTWRSSSVAMALDRVILGHRKAAAAAGRRAASGLLGDLLHLSKPSSVGKRG